MSTRGEYETAEREGGGNLTRDDLARRQTQADSVRVARVAVSAWERRLFKAAERIQHTQREHGRIERRLSEARRSLAAMESVGGLA